MTTNGRFMLVKFSVPMRFVVLQKAMAQWNDNVIYIYISFIQATQHLSNKTPKCFHANTNLNATFAK